MSSRLFQEVRERRALCYAIYAFASGLSDSGMFAIYAACGPDRADQLLAVVRDELLRAADSGFSEDEMARVKAQVKMGLLAGLESASARAEQLARHILIHGRALSTERVDRKGRKRHSRRRAALGAGSACVADQPGHVLDPFFMLQNSTASRQNSPWLRARRLEER